MFKQDGGQSVTLSSLSLEGWTNIELNAGKTSINWSNMFKGICFNVNLLEGLKAISYNKTYTIDATEMFSNTKFFIRDGVDLSGWFSGKNSQPKLSCASYMFSDASIEGSLNVSSWDASLLYDVSYMFNNISQVVSINMTN